MSKFLEVFRELSEKVSLWSMSSKRVVAAITALSLVLVGCGSLFGNKSTDSDGLSDTETTWYTDETETELATEVVHEISAKLETSSIDKDLKIKVVDEKGDLVAGYEFEFKVAQVRNLEEKEESSKKLVLEDLKMEDYTSKKYVDDDKDGMVHILNIEGGDYLVALAEVEDIIIEQNMILAEVKGKLEYKKVEIKNEVKNESQVNVKVEDTAVNDVVVESVVTDTLPLLATTVISSEVNRNDVDMSNFPKASKNQDYTVELTGKVLRYCTAHDYGETKENEIPAKCEEGGSFTKVLTCKLCNNVTKENMTVDALGHQAGAAVEENRVEAAVGQAGSYEAVVYCTRCSKEMSREVVVIPALAEPSTEPSTEPPVEPTTEPVVDPAVIEGEESSVTTRRVMGNSLVAAANVESIAATDTTQTGVPYAVDAKATIGLPYLSKLFTHSAESQQIKLALNIVDEQGVIDKTKIVFEIDHTDVADFVTDDDEDPTTVMIKGKKPGTVNVGIYVPIATVDANNQVTYKTEKLSCIVTVDNYEGEELVHIKDNAGNLLYIDKNCTKPANPSHFTNVGIPLYGAPKYTGWTIIDGKLYYYKADYTPATGSQVIGGVQYTFNEDGTLQAGNQSLGIDVSKWQGNINWTAVAQSGVKFAIIRCAYRGASTGVIVEDPYFRQNIQGATANGIKVGVYFFTQAVNEYEAVEEASTAIGLVAGYSLAYPIFIDTESATNGRANGLDVATRTAVVKAFCETVRNSGYKPGIYASKSWYNSRLDMSQLNQYNIWVAQYNTACTYGGRYDIWQYSSKGSIPGINGNVDVNIGYTNY